MLNTRLASIPLRSPSPKRSEKRASVPVPEGVQSFLSWLERERRNRLSTVQRCASSLQAFVRAIPERSLASLSPDDIERFKELRRREGIGEATLRNDCHAISKLFRWAMRHRLCDSNPVSQVDIPSERGSQRMYVVSPEEEERYFASVQDQDLRDLGSLMLETGSRPSEILSLESRDVDLARRTIKITDSKTAAGRRTLFLSQEAFEIASQRLADGRLTLFLHGGHPGRMLVKVDALHKAVAKALGMDWVLYSLRHTFASRLAAKGCPLATLAAILGHSSLRIVTRYIHPDQQQMNSWMGEVGQGAETPSR